MQPIIINEQQIWDLLETVSDPEVPVLSVTDLGVVRAVHIDQSNHIEVVITPTYSGCPAMNVIEINIRAALQNAGHDKVTVTTVLQPAWTTDWLTERGKQRLLEYGIAPPVGSSVDKNELFADEKIVPCPQCGSEHTKMISQFGSTACKSLYKCQDCLEPFDYFKCH
ncbi:MAG: 1,2-phenylacetyl-CoA epoxidase subunit PaaD [Bacteroidota bacterium]